MTQPLPIPDACQFTLDAVLVDPLDPGAEAEAHMQICRACSEARVAYLAQEDAPEPLAPAGYHERLPDRVLRKLPARSSLRHRVQPFLWSVAAVLLVAVSAGAFWAGRANRTPVVEANLPKSVVDFQEITPDTPFLDREDVENEDAVTQLTALPEEEANAVIRTLATRHAQPAVEP